MASSTKGVSDDTTSMDLTPGVTGNGAGGSWHHAMSPNAWAWFYIIAALLALWGLGYTFR